MENKINIAELLRNCPKGMELYSPIFGKVYLDKIRHHLAIVVTIDKEQGDLKEEFLYDGRYGMNGECMLFPSKNKTTWDGFVPPGIFKDGDILYLESDNHDSTLDSWILIYKENENEEWFYKYVALKNHYSNNNNIVHHNGPICYKKDIPIIRFATEEEKQKLLDAIEENGYKWNPETKTLEKFIEPKFKVGDSIKTRIKNSDYCHSSIVAEIRDDCFIIKTLDEFNHSYITDKLPFCKQNDWELVSDEIESKFKVGDRVKHKQSFISGVITNIDDDCYKIKYDSGAVSFAIIKYQDDWELVSDEIEPKFKVGNKIRLKGNPNYIYTINGIKENKSGCGVTFDLRFSEQDKNGNWFPKFDITTLKPFESRVLVRNFKGEIWKPAIWGCYTDDGTLYHYATVGGCIYIYLIPYEGNEHLLGKNKDCDEFYKTWEE